MLSYFPRSFSPRSDVSALVPFFFLRLSPTHPCFTVASRCRITRKLCGLARKVRREDFRRHDEESDAYDDVVSFCCGGADVACGHSSYGEAGKHSDNLLEHARGT